MTPREYVCRLERTIKRVVESFGVEDVCTTGDTGVWVGKDENLRKIGQIGIHGILCFSLLL